MEGILNRSARIFYDHKNSIILESIVSSDLACSAVANYTPEEK